MRYLTPFLLIFTFLCNCQNYPCIENNSANSLESINIVNGGAKWNCGLNEWSPSSLEIADICDGLSNLEKVTFTNVRISHWRLDIYLNDNENTFPYSGIMLFNPKEGGLVFRTAKGYYKNDKLARYIIEKMNINMTNDIPCN